MARQFVLSFCFTSAVNYRGKRFSHDVDLLLSHADQKVTDILLDTLVDHLKREVSYQLDDISGQSSISMFI